MKPAVSLRRSAIADTVYRVQVIDRALSIVNLLAASNHPLGAWEAGEKLGLNKSTVHRLLAVLEHHRFVERDLMSGKYRLGLKLAELGNIALSRFDLQASARPFVERLVEVTGETAHLGILQQNEVVSLVNVETQRSVRTPSTVGRRSPVHCTSQGKLLLAFQPQPLVDQMLRSYYFASYTKRTIRQSGAYRAELVKVRQAGFATDDEEFEEGLRCIGAPVRDHTGKVVAAISIAGPTFRITPERTPVLIQNVMSVAGALSEALGYHRAASSPEVEPKIKKKVRVL
jgi:IclR family transcriptional regulator, KDG regulon repressor